MQTFISVHNQDYILELEKNRVFRNLSDYKYLFLGFNPVDKLEHLKDKLIVARELPDNIEDKKRLLDFTGWYAISRNKLAKDEHFIVIHYDCLIYKSFEHEIEKAFKKNKELLISFQPYPITTQMQKKYTETLFRAIKEIYAVDSQELIKKAIKEGKINYPAGGSFACSVKWLDSFVGWMEKICPILITDPLAALAVERAIKIFDLIYNIDEKYLPQIMTHIYNANHEQEYASKECQAKQRAKFARFMNGELSEEIEAQRKEKNYLKLLKITLKQLIYKLF